MIQNIYTGNNLPVLDLKFFPLSEKAKLPSKGHDYDSGMDVCTTEEDVVIIYPHNRHIFKTGLASIIPTGWDLSVCDRSSMGSKGVTYTAGIIDEGYTGEIGIILVNCVEKIAIFTNQDKEEVEKSVFFDKETNLFAPYLPLDIINENPDRYIFKEEIIVKYLSDAVAQLKLTPVPRVNISWGTEEEFNQYKEDYTRGDDGYGSTNG